MVNIVDTFTRMYGRSPTEAELGAMIKMKADIEAYENRKLRPTVDLMTKSRESQKRAQEAAKKRQLKKGISINLRGWTVNCLLLADMSKQDISNALCITDKDVETLIRRYKLPRADTLKPRKYVKGKSNAN